MKNGWALYHPTEDDPWKYVVPNDDFKGHAIESRECECEPKIDWENQIIIHNAFDHRECVEQAEAMLRDGENE